jgi:hypothetical protein
MPACWKKYEVYENRAGAPSHSWLLNGTIATMVRR